MATPQPVDARTQPWRETPGGDLVALGRPVRQALHLVRHNPAQGRVLSRRETILLVLFALTLHGAVIHWLSQQRTPALPEVPPQVPPMTIEFTAPAPPVGGTAAARAVAAGGRGTATTGGRRERGEAAAAEAGAKAETQAQAATPAQAGAEGRRAGSARAAATRRATRPADAGRRPGAADAAVGERRLPAQPGAGIPRPGHAPRLGGHRAVAGACPRQRQPSEIQVQKSSGREALDQAAVKAVKRWSFVPAKRGDKAEDGWVSVPIDFKLN